MHENHGLRPLNSLRTSVPTTLQLDGKGPRFDAAHSEKVSFPHWFNYFNTVLFSTLVSVGTRAVASALQSQRRRLSPGHSGDPRERFPAKEADKSFPQRALRSDGRQWIPGCPRGWHAPRPRGCVPRGDRAPPRAQPRANPWWAPWPPA